MTTEPQTALATATPTPADDIRPRSFRTVVICWLVYAVFRFILGSCRVRVSGADHRARAEGMHPKKSFAIALWHEHLFSAVGGHAWQNISPMISASDDGELVAFAARHVGLTPVRGSTSRDGKAAVEELQRRLQQGINAAVTVDGPKGPRRKVKSGIVELSRSHQIPILPMASLASRYWVLGRTWDKFRIPKPFSRIIICYGAPFVVPSDCHGAEFATAKRTVAAALQSVEEAAQQELKQWNQR